MPDYAKARTAVISMFELFERVPTINNHDAVGGETFENNEYDPNIKLEKEFTYPTRPDAKILKGIELAINRKGTRLHLLAARVVGTKSGTPIIRTFYDPDLGNVNLINKSKIFYLHREILNRYICKSRA